MRVKRAPKKTSRSYMGLVPVIFLVAFAFVIYTYVTPEALIRWLGVENSYVLLFTLAFIGGLTTFSGVPYHLFVITMAVGGLHPLLLGLTAAFGVMAGDSTSYYVGYKGGAYLPAHFQYNFERLRKLIVKYPKLFPVFCFLYGAMVPLSNDFITITSGLMKYPYWKMIIPLGLGNIAFNISVAYMALYATDILNKFL